MKRLALLLATAALASLGFGLSGVLQAAPGPQTLNATVGPGFTISLRKGTGPQIVSLVPGAYRFLVKDLGTTHNAHLRGPAVNRKTGIAAKATTTWTVTLKAGQYRLFCDVHKSMNRAFKVALRPSGTTPGPAPPPTNTAPPPTYDPPDY